MPGFVIAERNLRVIERKYRCPSCHHLLRDPVQTNCGHHYCRTCLESLKLSWSIMSTLGLSGRNMRCIVDGEYLSETEVFPDRALNREVLNLRVNCLCHKKGCGWMGEVRDYELHNSSCGFHHESCINRECDMVMERRHLTNHMRNECPFRLVRCEFCSDQVVVNQVEAHQRNYCQGFPIICRHCGKREIPRGKMKDHLDPLQGDCEVIELCCPYTIAGCPYKEKVQRKQLRAHLDESFPVHLDLILFFIKHFEENVQNLAVDRRFSSERNENAACAFRSVGQLCTEISASRDRSNHVQSDVDGIVKRLQKLETNWERLRNNLDRVPLGSSVPPVLPSDQLVNANDLQQQCAKTASSCRFLHEYLNQLRTSLVVHVTELGDSMAQQERRVNEQNNAIAELTSRVETMGQTSYDGTLIWKIRNVRRWLRHGNAPMRSPCIYTSRLGYKMCVKLSRENSSISLSFVIMRGELDARLRWPFQQRVTIKIVNQDNAQDLIHNINPDGSASYEKPTTDANAPSACVALWQISDLDRAYIREDTMFIEVIVDTSGL